MLDAEFVYKNFSQFHNCFIDVASLTLVQILCFSSDSGLYLHVNPALPNPIDAGM